MAHFLKFYDFYGIECNGSSEIKSEHVDENGAKSEHENENEIISEDHRLKKVNYIA